MSMNPEAALIYRQYIEPMSKTIREYEEINHAVKELMGFDLIMLKDLLAMGYTLKHPDHDLTPAQCIKVAEIMHNREVYL